MSSTMTRWLDTLSADQLARLLAARPETLVPPAPSSLAELADRLHSRPGVILALQSLPRPAVQLLEVIRGFDCATRAEVAGRLGITERDQGLADSLTRLAEHALAWEIDGQLILVGELQDGLGYPLRLGPPAAELLSRAPVTELRALAARLGLTTTPAVKKTILRALDEFYADADRVRKVANAAPPDPADLLAEVVWRGPAVTGPGLAYSKPAGWLQARGLMLPDGWERQVMPREVTLALRGPGWRPPWQPEPPQATTRPTDAVSIRRESAAASGTAIDQADAVLAAAPVTLLKTGGVGTRELRRLAKKTTLDEPTVRLWLALGCQAGLLTDADDDAGDGRATRALLLTDEYDEFTGTEPADRLTRLLSAWIDLTDFPTRASAGALPDDASVVLAVRLRIAVLDLLAAIPDDVGLVDPVNYLTEAVGWQLPIIASAFVDLPGAVGSVCREAETLGAVGHGALTPLGRAMLDPEPQALYDTARSLVEAAIGTAIFQADLTAVVPGTPSAQLTELLDSAADRESRGAASTWRFGTASVRRALDAGRDAQTLADALRAAAVGGTLPQPLEYLLADVARRHGEVLVREVACVLHTPDETRLAEVLATRSLSTLGLTRLAPTVLGSARPAGETLAALRAAGYAPIGEDVTGGTLVTSAPRRRAPVAGIPAARARAAGRTSATGGPAGRSAAPVSVRMPTLTDPFTLAAALRAGPARSTTDPYRGQPDPYRGQLE